MSNPPNPAFTRPTLLSLARSPLISHHHHRHPAEYDQKKLLKAFKKEFACNGTIVDDEELGQVIQLQGDQRQKVATFIVQEGITPKTDVKVHGF